MSKCLDSIPRIPRNETGKNASIDNSGRVVYSVSRTGTVRRHSVEPTPGSRSIPATRNATNKIPDVSRIMEDSMDAVARPCDATRSLYLILIHSLGNRGVSEPIESELKQFSDELGVGLMNF